VLDASYSSCVRGTASRYLCMYMYNTILMHKYIIMYMCMYCVSSPRSGDSASV
jgi:hypothetical protein